MYLLKRNLFAEQMKLMACQYNRKVLGCRFSLLQNICFKKRGSDSCGEIYFMSSISLQEKLKKLLEWLLPDKQGSIEVIALLFPVKKCFG